jgi:hypothetical protein
MESICARADGLKEVKEDFDICSYKYSCYNYNRSKVGIYLRRESVSSGIPGSEHHSPLYRVASRMRLEPFELSKNKAI